MAAGLPDEDAALTAFFEQPGADGVYQLYALYIDYSGGIDAQPEVTLLPLTSENTSENWLVATILSENDGDYGDSKNVAAFLLQDDNEFLVLAVDEWDSSPADGWIQLRSYVYDSDTPPSLTLLDTEEFQGSNLSWHHRRPVLAKTLLDSSDAPGLSWSNYDDEPGTSGLDPPGIDWRKIEVDETTSTFGNITETDDYTPSMTDVEHARALFAYKGKTRTARPTRSGTTAPNTTWR